MIINGVLHTLTRALRKPIDAPEVVDAMAIAGFPATKETFDLGEQQRVYYSTPDSAVQFLFEDGVLRTVFVATQDDGSTAAFARADELIDGLSGTASRAEVREFAVDDVFQHVIFVDDRMARITAMSTDPAEW